MIKHIAFIMDGNRRWATKRGMFKFLGHKQGLETVKIVSDFCLKKQIQYLSLYTFSLENLKRPKEEKNYLFKMLVDESDSLLKNLKEKEVRAKFVGERSLFPEQIIPVCQKIESQTSKYSKLNINFCFCYGARQEIVNGVKNIAKKLKSGELSELDINEDTLNSNLWTSDFPDPDLIVRTGGRARLSNFLLYQAAYSELYFLDCLWPDLDEAKLEEVFLKYAGATRNFGL